MKAMEGVGITLGIFLVIALIATLALLEPTGHWGDVNPAIALISLFIAVFALVALAIKRL